ncbi:MAG: hypothetical protein JWR04_723 [Rhodoglobus sp.]|jgi:hypothetical protein|nr:hypothetical protein [Rhodoglobus sp.]
MTLWHIALIAAGAAIVLAILAAAVKRDWIALPIVLVIGYVLALRVAGIPTPTDGWFSPVLGAELVALATAGGGPLVAFVLRVIVKTPQKLGKHGGIVLDDDDGHKRGKPERHEVLRGGTTIGYLERFAVAGAVLVGQPAAVAIIVAVKGLGRFTELDSAAARERFIVGTLLSLIWAAVCTAGIISAW